MATATETLRATLSETEYRALTVLAESTAPLSGRQVATALEVSPTTGNRALRTLGEAGFATSEKSGRAHLWLLTVSNPSISAWLEEMTPRSTGPSAGSSPYATGGGGVRLEHSYAACLVVALLAGEPVAELGDAVSVDSIRLQASDISPVDDIVVEGLDAGGELHRSYIAVRRSPSLTRSDSASVPLIRDFLTVVCEQWPELESGRQRLVLAVSTTANAITQLAELAELARTIPSGAELETRLSQPGRINTQVHARHAHVKDLVEQASQGLAAAGGLTAEELTWRFLSSLTVHTLRLERTERADRAAAVSSLQRVLHEGTLAAADALFSRIEELVGNWASQAAVLTQSVIRRSLGSYHLLGSPRYAHAWTVIARLGARLRASIRPSLRAGVQTLELPRQAERPRLEEAMRAAGTNPGALIVTGDPDVGKSALCLRAAEALQQDGAVVAALSLRDLPPRASDFDSQLGGFDVSEVLAAGESSPTRLLLIDGAEAVLEGRGPMLTALAAAALTVGIGVVAVTRTDGSRQATRVLSDALELAGSNARPVEHIVGPLDQIEREELAATFPTLARLRGDPRAHWLLGRPGLVDALLRTGESLNPADFLCEADVYSAVWRSLIRHDEVHTPGTASPDDRERAALSAGLRSLGLPGGSVPGTASAELRSDGVLQVPNDPALSTGDEFSTDLIRDFALCRLFLVEGWEALVSAGAPRWSIRAVRLGCQARFRTQGASRAWESLSARFAQISDSHGERWLEVPFEALLTLGDAESAIRELWDALSVDDGAALATLFRLAEARYIEGTIGDAFALAPLVRVAFCERPAIGLGPRSGYRSVQDVIQSIVLAWLRGMAISRPEPDSLRQAVRDCILADDPPLYDSFAIESLATLGSDLDDRAETWLRQVATDRPSHLEPAVESLAVALGMSQAHPELLLDLAEAYYLELPDPRDRWGGGHSLDDGIRDLQHGTGGFGGPGAAWYYGPFFRLLNAIPVQAVAMINRMLDHAARFRVDKLSSYGSGAEGQDDSGLELKITGAGARQYIGDSHVWSWYRGSGVGPYPCMSALLALERFADHLLEKVNLPASAIVEFLLRDCHNLAVPGLIVGFLTRHPNEAGELLDPFLAHPEIWQLETSRVTSAYFTVRDPDADKLTGLEHRGNTMHQTVAAMVINARIRGDDKRLARLSEIGNELMENARSGLSSAAGESEYLAIVDGWAAQFKLANYRLSGTEGGILVQFERPPEIEKILAPSNRDLQAANTLYGLQNRYGRYNDDPDRWPLENLSEDLATARQADDSGSVPESFQWPENPLVSVAAAAVRAHALGRATLSRSDLGWAAETIMRAAEHPVVGELDYSGSMFSMGADRAAAAAAPLLLLPPFDDLNLDRSRIQRALQALSTSVFDEVRAIYVQGCKPLWPVLCEPDGATGECRRHAAAWAAATLGLADCRLGPWDQETQTREPAHLSGPYAQSLPSVKDKDMLVNRLRMPLACMVDARKVPCLQSAVAALWTPLWDAHRRGLAHWWKKGYDHQAHITHEPIARRMIEVALGGDQEPIKAHIDACAKDSNALHLLFEGFARVFTYDASLRQSMGDFWPWAMGAALDAVGDGRKLRSKHHWFDYMTAALLPTPNPRSSDEDIDGTLVRSRDDWLQPEALDGLAERWLRLARWEAKAVDAVIKFGKCAPRTWQTTTELSWVEAIIDGRYDLVANHLFYAEEWLTELRNADLDGAEVVGRYHKIVDGLAAAGDRVAVRVQKLDE